MTDLVTSSPPEHSVAVSESEAQLDRLDSLLEQYLNLLHEYQKTRSEVSEHFSKGFFSLAQANFNNNTGTRYGQDYYDERMQASHRITISTKDETTSFEPLSQPIESPVKNEDDEAASKSKGNTDPLRWFGILVPPALRSAQSDFEAAVNDPIPKLASITNQMRALDSEISRLRKSIKRLQNEITSEKMSSLSM